MMMTMMMTTIIIIIIMAHFFLYNLELYEIILNVGKKEFETNSPLVN
jgi:uncharacterized membrane protein